MGEIEERVAKAIFASDMKWAPVLEHQFEENKIVYLKAARAAIEAMPGWQPIETAPKDGSTIDLWCRNISHGSTGSVRVADAFWDDEVSKWEDRHGWILEQKWRPTHWMPLPAPPAAREARNKAQGE